MFPLARGPKPRGMLFLARDPKARGRLYPARGPTARGVFVPSAWLEGVWCLSFRREA